MDPKSTPPAGTPIPITLADPMDRLFAAIENVQQEVHATRAESRMRGEETAHRLDKLDKRLDGLEGADKTLTTEFQRLRRQVDELDRRTGTLERDVQRVGDRSDATSRALEASQAAHASEMKGLIVHVEKATKTLNDRGEAIGEMKTEVDSLKASSDATTEALGAIVEELGIEDRVKLGKTPRPGEKPEPALAKIEKRAQNLEVRVKSSTIVQAIIALGVIAGLLKQIFFPN